MVATKPFKVVVTWIASEHSTRKEALTYLKKLKPQHGALGVVIEHHPILTPKTITEKTVTSPARTQATVTKTTGKKQQTKGTKR